MAKQLDAATNRLSFGTINTKAESPDLLDIQLSSIKEFLQEDVLPEKRKNQGGFLPERINNITEHLRENKKDHSGRRGLLIMVSKRRKLLNYTKKKNMSAYMELIKDLKIRK